MTRVRQLGYVGFGVADPDAWNTFLTGTVGLGLAGKSDAGALRYRLDHHRSRVHVVPTGEDDLVHLGWMVADEAELEAMEQRLRDAGIPPERGSAALAAERDVLALTVVTDPCGLRTEIFCGPAVSYDEPLVPGRPLAGGFVAGDQGVGHVVVKSQDPEAYRRFYLDVLGLRLTDHIAGPGMTIAFLHANARHHSLAFPQIPLPPGGRRIQHVMFQLTDLDDLGRGQDIAEQRGELLERLGRHTNDHMLSCYIASPSGIGVEYGWGARELTDGWVPELHTTGGAWGHTRVGDRTIFDIEVPGAGSPPGAGGPG